MNGIVEVAYTLLLGWMRAVTDWFWRVVSGDGGGFLSWFLSNWKVLLVVLLVGGLIVDWLMWVIRWRPHWLLFGKARPATVPDTDWEDETETEGYYAPDADSVENMEWTDMTLRTLSEIDPDWAGGVVMEEEPPEPPYTAEGYYNEAYEEQPQAGWVEPQAESGYWEASQDELEEAEPPQAPLPYDDAEVYGEDGAQGYDGAAQAYDPQIYARPVDYARENPYAPPAVLSQREEVQNAPQTPVADGEEGGFDPFAPYDDPAMLRYAAQAESESQIKPEAETETDEPGETAQLYGRPGYWPGQFPLAQSAEADAPENVPETAASQSAPRRRRRLLQSSVPEYERETPPVSSNGGYASFYDEEPAADTAPRAHAHRRLAQYEQEAGEAPRDDMPAFYPPPAPPSLNPRVPESARPERLVRPAAQERKQDKNRKRGLRTVTGKPAKRRGLLSFAATDEEPIAGLPPMEIENAFHPMVHPNGNPDFAQDEGEEFNR